MSGPIGPSPFSGSESFSFKQFNDLIAGIEQLYKLSRRLSEATANQPCEYLIQEGRMAFAKAMMSVLGFLRFIPSSQYYATQIEVITDLSSASVMARQVMLDAITFFYLAEPGLKQQEKDFRRLVWRYGGATEMVESAIFAGGSNLDLAQMRAIRDLIGQDFENPPFKVMLGTIKGDRRGRILKGQENHALHDREILERRGIEIQKYDLFRKVLSNFAHFSTFSHAMMLQTGAGSTEIWKRFLAPARCVAHFSAEAVEVFLETFPQTRQLLQNCEPALIMNFRSSLGEE